MCDLPLSGMIINFIAYYFSYRSLELLVVIVNFFFLFSDYAVISECH